jgi:Outer membrane protein beta-barrel domain
MSRAVAIMSVVTLLAAVPAFAQEVAPGPGTVEVTIIPGGGTFFTSKGEGPDFGNYTYGGALAVNFNRYVGIEGEVGGTVGIAQDLTFRGTTANLKTPNTLTYNGNVVVNATTGHAIVPFVTGGVGGLTMFERAELGINDMQTFLTGNVGGGVKWYASNGRWGLRADYRFIAVRSKDDAPDFFSQDTRYGHRVYGAVVINAVR